MRYICANCGKEHEEWPAIAFNAPYQYGCLSEADKEEIAELGSDFCIIRHDDQADRFVRAVLRQKVYDHCEDLEYGVWVSLSEKSFNDYEAHFEDEEYEAGYFGYLCNWIPGYDEDTNAIKTNVQYFGGGNRPEVVPQEGQDAHPFLTDYFNGISKAEAERRIRHANGEQEDMASG